MGLLLKLAVVAAAAGVLLQGSGIHVPAAIVAATSAARIGAQGYFGAGLWLQESLSSHPPHSFIYLGYWNALQLKVIYMLRFVFQDNFFFEDWVNDVHTTILRDFELRGLLKDHDIEFPIPSYDFSFADLGALHSEHISTARPVVLRGARMQAANWTGKDISSRYGAFPLIVYCENGTASVQSIQQYLDHVAAAPGSSCRIDSGKSNLMIEYPELAGQIGIDRLASLMGGYDVDAGQMQSKIISSDLYYSVSSTRGSSFRAVNHHSVFVMLRGSARWTTISPSNSFLMYPLFDSMFEVVQSWLTWQVLHAPNAGDIVRQYFPLYRYAPRQVFELNAGDILVNPPWNWYMIESVGTDETIGIECRFDTFSDFPRRMGRYTNSLFSLLQFLSKDLFLQSYRQKSGNFQPTVNEFLSFDLASDINFGGTESIWKRSEFVASVVSPSVWDQFVSKTTSGS